MGSVSYVIGILCEYSVSLLTLALLTLALLTLALLTLALLTLAHQSARPWHIPAVQPEEESSQVCMHVHEGERGKGGERERERGGGEGGRE